MNLPEIISSSIVDDVAKYRLAISAELQAFEGHFDDAPIIPGVEQLRWVMHFTQQAFELSQQPEVGRVDALKFQNVIQPGYEIELQLQLKENRVDFQFTSTDLRHSSGKVFFD